MAIFVSNIVIEQGFDFNTTFQLEDTAKKLLEEEKYELLTELKEIYEKIKK